MECTLGVLEISWFAEFQIASGAISNLQTRAHLREGTPATLSGLVGSLFTMVHPCSSSFFVTGFQVSPRAVFSRPARRVSQRSAPGASDRSGHGDAEVCVGMLLPPVVIRQVFVLSIRFLLTRRLLGLVWTR